MHEFVYVWINYFWAIIKHHPDIPDYVSPGHTDGSVQA